MLGSVTIAVTVPDPPPVVLLLLILIIAGLQTMATVEWIRLGRQQHGHDRKVCCGDPRPVRKMADEDED